MKSKDLSAKPKEELETLLAEQRKELVKLNTQVATKTSLKSPGQVRNVKKTIARIMTELKKK